jgi:hypothetical protein
MPAFDVDAFIAGINSDKQVTRNSKERLNRILMNAKDNQGTLTFIPCFSKEVSNFYLKIPRVYEYYGDSSILNDGEGWYKLLPIDFYGDLSEEQIELYNEIKGYLDWLQDGEYVDYNEFRVRNYSLMFGICQKLKNTDDKENDKLVDCPCIFTFPSPDPINQLCDAINTRVDNMGGRKDWVNKVFSLDNKGRRGVVQIKFVKAAGAGYDCSVQFFMNNSDEGIIAIDPEYEISDDTFKYFDTVLPTFIGWLYDRDSNSRFNTVIMKELRDQLKLRVKSLKESEGSGEGTKKEETPENKNNLTQGAGGQSTSPRRPF